MCLLCVSCVCVCICVWVCVCVSLSLSPAVFVCVRAWHVQKPKPIHTLEFQTHCSLLLLDLVDLIPQVLGLCTRVEEWGQRK